MRKNTSTRFIKTQTLIDKSFIQLIENIGFSKISVKKLLKLQELIVVHFTYII